MSNVPSFSPEEQTRARRIMRDCLLAMPNTRAVDDVSRTIMLAFDTDHPGIEVSDRLKGSLVTLTPLRLNEKYQGLFVGSDGLTLKRYFNPHGTPKGDSEELCSISIPFDAITGFHDAQKQIKFIFADGKLVDTNIDLSHAFPAERFTGR